MQVPAVEVRAPEAQPRWMPCICNVGYYGREGAWQTQMLVHVANHAKPHYQFAYTKWVAARAEELAEKAQDGDVSAVRQLVKVLRRFKTAATCCCGADA